MATQWFNPLALFALKAFRSDQEAACDADVLRYTAMSPRAYGGALVKAVKLTHPVRTTAFAAGLPLTHAIKDRLVLMQSPAPSRRKKWLGSAIIGGLGTLAVMTTASAHPPSADIVIQDGELTIDGKVYSDRKFVLLDDPIQNDQFEFHFDGEFADLGELLGENSEEIAKLFSDLDLEANIELDGLEGLASLAELEIAAEIPSMLSDIMPEIDVTTLDNGSVQIVIPKQKIIVSTNAHGLEFAQDWAEHAHKLERRGQAFEKRMGAFEGRAEALAEKFAERAEARAEAFAKRAEARAEAFAQGAEWAAMPSATAVDKLARQCADQELSEGAPVIVEQNVEGAKRSLKAICLKGANGQHMSDQMKDFVKDHPDLTEAQRNRLVNKLNQRHVSRYRFELRGGPDPDGQHAEDPQD